MNVDYVVNFVFLRLNFFDILFVSIVVLIMMVWLLGLCLVLFFDDVVELIFVVLENYYGYILFVESLFLVLNEIVGLVVKVDRIFLISFD